MQLKMMKDNVALYSIVIPVYKSENVLAKTIGDVRRELIALNINFEILLVDDGSPDLSWRVMQQLSEDHHDVKSIRLVKNYGQHTAVFCGIVEASGDYIITMDDDGQNPPEELSKLINKINEGYDAVFAKFKTKKHAQYRKLGSKIVLRLNRAIFGVPKDLILSNYRIFTKDVAQRIANHSTNYPYIPGLIIMNGSTFANVETEHKKREEGASNYSTKKIFELVLRLLINYSSYPMKILSYVGIIFTILALGLAGYVLIKALLAGSNVEGWTSLMIVISLFNGIMVMMISLLGLYVSRVLNQVSQPTYQVRKRVNLKQ